jgi:hypothetical protein
MGCLWQSEIGFESFHRGLGQFAWKPTSLPSSLESGITMKTILALVAVMVGLGVTAQADQQTTQTTTTTTTSSSHHHYRHHHHHHVHDTVVVKER